VTISFSYTTLLYDIDSLMNFSELGSTNILKLNCKGEDMGDFGGEVRRKETSRKT
jgi:hypothetical protein